MPPEPYYPVGKQLSTLTIIVKNKAKVKHFAKPVFFAQQANSDSKQFYGYLLSSNSINTFSGAQK